MLSMSILKIWYHMVEKKPVDKTGVRRSNMRHEVVKAGHLESNLSFILSNFAPNSSIFDVR